MGCKGPKATCLGGMPRKRVQGQGKSPQCTLNLLLDEEKRLLSCRSFTFVYVSLQTSEAKEKKIIIEDCLEELVCDISLRLNEAGCY
jgi:hypothetical protein